LKKILFLCAKNRLRSPTAEQIFCDLEGYEVASAGVNADADVPVDREMVENADLIFVMEKRHRSKLQRRFRLYLKKARVICLDIPDDYAFMDTRLIVILRQKVTPHLR
jgi:predicted protein tyrosine phosphatase